MKIHYKGLFTVILSLLLFKALWVSWSCWNFGTLKEEKNDLLQRRNYLIEEVVVDPEQLLRKMPGCIGLQFQGEWALYTCSMFTEALTNMAYLYPKTKDYAIMMIDSLIQIVMSPELRSYDTLRWGEDPLESLDGNKSHISYLSHLAWMIGNYRSISGDSRYSHLHDSICEAMNRRILLSQIMNLPTYPEEHVYVPDMLVAIVAMSEYARINDGKYSSLVESWINRAKSEWIDDGTGLLCSFLDESGKVEGPVKGSYAALNCYYLTKIDDKFAKEQYERLKYYFCQTFPASGIKEYHNHFCLFCLDVDAGPVIFNLSPSGTAFAIGSATYFADKDFRDKLLKTAEIAGCTVSWGNRRHYLLTDIALVGEAITLAMRTNTKTN